MLTTEEQDFAIRILEKREGVSKLLIGLASGFIVFSMTLLIKTNALLWKELLSLHLLASAVTISAGIIIHRRTFHFMRDILERKVRWDCYRMLADEVKNFLTYKSEEEIKKASKELSEKLSDIEKMDERRKDFFWGVPLWFNIQNVSFFVSICALLLFASLNVK